MRSRGASGPAGWLRKGSAPKREEGREQRKERREKREERKSPQARCTAFLQCKTPRGLIIPCKNEGILFRESTAEERREDGRAQGEAFTAARKDHARKLKAALLDGLKKEESREKREEKREKRENGRKLDSLHFYRVPWPPRKSF